MTIIGKGDKFNVSVNVLNESDGELVSSRQILIGI